MRLSKPQLGWLAEINRDGNNVPPRKTRDILCALGLIKMEYTDYAEITEKGLKVLRGEL